MHGWPRIAGGGQNNVKCEKYEHPLLAWGGRACPPLINVATCRAYRNLDCKVGAFGPWSACSQDCDIRRREVSPSSTGCSGVTIRRREVKKVADFGGMVCPFIYKARPCSDVPDSLAGWVAQV